MFGGAWVVLIRKWKLKRNYFVLCLQSRPIIRPNTGFAMALQSLEKSLFNIATPTMPIYWMSDSYVNYLNYLEWKGRVESWKGVVGKGDEWSPSPMEIEEKSDSKSVEVETSVAAISKEE